MSSPAVCWVLAIVCGLYGASLWADQPGANSEAEQHFERANELHILAEYDSAIAEYEAVIELSPKTKIAQNAQYWIGQLYFEARQFDAALAAFEKLVDEYPDSTVIPTTQVASERAEQAKKDRAFFEAVQQAGVEQVRSLIADGADVDAEWGDISTPEEQASADGREARDTPLYWAIEANSMDLVKVLIEAGADVNAGPWSPLCVATRANNMDLVKLLVEAGGDVNAGGWTALCVAVTQNNRAIADYLIDHGANVNVQSPQGWSALCQTINVSDSVEMADLLIARGADMNAGYWPPITSAVREKRIDLLRLFLQRGADVNNTDRWEYTPLYFAVHNDDLNYLKVLISGGADLDMKQPGGETALMSGAVAGRTEAVRLLLEAGADVNARNDRGQTALHVMLDIRDSNQDIVKLLLDHGARINEKDGESGFTALHHAARSGNKQAADLLIAQGADINAKDKEGHTPLYVAVNYDYRVAALLMNKGADSSIETESGKTLGQLAQERKQIESTFADVIFDGDPNSAFGLRTACADVDGDGYDDILIAAVGEDNRRGRVYLFYGGSDMDTVSDLIFEGQNEGDTFGISICCGDIDNDGHDDIVIAAGHYNEGQGCAYLYWGSDRDSMDANPDKIFVGEQEKGSRFGAGHSAVYDIDNDGYDDIIMAAIHSNDKTGRVYLYYGNTKERMDTSADLVFIPQNPEYYFGYAISCADVDNDGYGDIIIGPYYNRQGARTYLYYGGSKSNMDAKADVLFEVNLDDADYFGESIVCIDRNRDGYDDVVVGAPGYRRRQGRTYIFHGNSKERLNAEPDLILDGDSEGSRYGSQEVYGDIDGDDVDDLVVGAGGSGPWLDRIYVYWGNELDGPDPRPSMILTGENPDDHFGQTLACGDVNNDGYDDLVIGAYGYKVDPDQERTYELVGNPPRLQAVAGAERKGRVYLYYGGPRNN